MMKNVAYAAVAVTDQERALTFYTDVVGLELRGDVLAPEGLRFITVGVPGQEFSLVLWPGTSATIAEGTASITFEVDDIAARFESLTSHGVDFQPAHVQEFPWGWVARFTDPDGNRLALRQGRA